MSATAPPGQPAPADAALVIPRQVSSLAELAADPFLAFLVEACKERDLLVAAPAVQRSLESLVFLLAGGATRARLLVGEAGPAQDLLLRHIAGRMQPDRTIMARIAGLARIEAPRLLDPVWREEERSESWCVVSHFDDPDLLNRAGRPDIVALPGLLAQQSEPLRLLLSAARLGADLVLDIPITPAMLPVDGAPAARLAEDGILHVGECDPAARATLVEFWSRQGQAFDNAWQWFFTQAGLERLLSVAGLEIVRSLVCQYESRLLVRCRQASPSQAEKHLVAIKSP